MDWDVVVVGAGAAGLVAAERAAARGLRTLLFEKNRKPGVKILMSGGTRCNLTQATDARGIVAAFGPQGRFLHSALASLGPDDLVALVNGEGVGTKVEETGKIFPLSNRAVDILNAFLARLRRSGAALALEEPLVEVERRDGGFQLTANKRTLTASKVIITSGGKSYPGCGTRGDGYEWARRFGHTIVRPRPALVPLLADPPWIANLKGVTIPDVALRVIDERVSVDALDEASRGINDSKSTAKTKAKVRMLDSRRGSFLFTHFGLSGPVVLDISRVFTEHIEPARLALECDFLPSIPEEALQSLLQQAAAASGKKAIPAVLPSSLPQRLVESLVNQADIESTTRVGELSRPARARLVERLKRQRIVIRGTRGFEKAEVTAGGVALDEVDSRTMESKLIPGLYWAGEVLDLDGPIGGYNFQSAFSTGWLAGKSV